MNDDEHGSDTVLIQELRDSLSGLPTPERPPLAAVTSRGRAHQRRRRAGFAGLGVAGVAAGTALALGLAGVLGGAPARSTGPTRTVAPARSTGTIRTADFILTSNANGTVTLRLTFSQLFNPAALQHAFRQDNIPALVKTGAYCSSNPPAFVSGVVGKLFVLPPFFAGAGLWQPGPQGSGLRGWTLVINPAAMPSGTELFVGYLPAGLVTNLIYTSSYTCSSHLP
jgi:hypothetical protein